MSILCVLWIPEAVFCFLLKMFFEEQLISLVRENESLYNIKSKNYKNVLKRNQTWEKISQELNKPVADCRQRWKSLRDRFVREKRSLEKPSGSGAVLNERWEFYDQLEFLIPSLKPRRQTGNFFKENSPPLELTDEFLSPTSPGGVFDVDGVVPTSKKRKLAKSEEHFKAFLGEMNEKAKMELSTLCRVCMKTISVDCIELDSPLNDKTYLECFNYCTKLNVFLHDGLPRKICISCGRSLKITYEFVKSAHEADNFLRENFILTKDNATQLDGVKHEQPYFVESLEEEVDIDPLVIGSSKQLKEETVCYEGKHKAIEPKFEIIFDAEVPKDRIEDNDLNLSLNEKDIPSVDGLTIRKTHTNKTGSQVCRLCGEVFENRINLNQHKLAEHRGKHVGLCITCGQSFPDENCLKRHTALEHFSSACQYCKKKISIIGLKKHIRTMHGDVLPTAEKNEFICEYCSKFFSSDKKLKDHLNTHTGKRPYVCEACGNSYHSERNLRYHKKTMHDTQYEYAEPRKCQKCDFSTTNRLLWIKHGRRHDKPKRNIQKYLCASCPKKFLFPKLLEQHEIFAHGDKNVGPQCKVCNKIYRNYDCLKSHMMVHSEERPFECKECPKTFKYMTSLHTHEKLHKGKQVECPHCDKKVLSPRDLKIHLMTHTGERPFECHLCDRKFAVKGRLTDHLKRQLHK